MKSSKKFNKNILAIFIFIYLFIGVVYALGGGYYQKSLNREVGNKSADQIIERVLWAKISEVADLYLCVSSDNVSSLVHIPLAKIRSLKQFSKEDDIEELYISGALVLGREYFQEGCNRNFDGYENVEISSEEVFASTISDAMSYLKKINESMPGKLSLVELENTNKNSGEIGKKFGVLSNEYLRPDSHELLIDIENKVVPGDSSKKIYYPIAFLGDVILYPYHFFLLFRQV